MRKLRRIIREWFVYEPNKELMKNLEDYDKKEKAEQQESEVQNTSTNKSRD